MKRKTRINTSTLPALTPFSVQPSGKQSLPEPSSCPGQEHPQVAPDLKVESILYSALQWEIQRNRALTEQVNRLDREFREYRRLGKIKHVAKSLKPAHNAEPKKVQ